MTNLPNSANGFNMDWVPQEDFLQKLMEVLEDSFIPDSDVQKMVQENLRELQNNPEFCNYLLWVCVNKQQFNDKMRALAALILKNTIAFFYNNIPVYLKEQMQPKCLSLLSDHSKEVRLSASVLINMMVQKEGIVTMGNVIPYLLGLLVLDENEVCNSAMKTLVLIVEDYMHMCMQMQRWHIEEQIKELLVKFIELTGHRQLEVRHRAFRLLNDILQKHYVMVRCEFNTASYLEKLIAFANQDDAETIMLVLQGFVIFINNQDEAILPSLNDVICYILNKSTSEDSDIALHASEFWLAVSKLPTCVDILRGHLKHLLPILLNNMKYSDFELSILKDTLGKDVDEQDKAEDVKPFAKVNDDDDDDPDISWTLRKCSAASLDALAVQYEHELIELILPPIVKNLESPDLLLKESAILAFGAVADGCFNSLIKILPNLVPVLLQCMKHQHSLIRSITCWTLSRYTRFTVFYDDKIFLATMMVFLEHCLDENKRVQRASLSAFCFFQEEAKMRLVPYADMIMQTFMRGIDMYQTRSLYLLYDAIGVFATCTTTHFVPMLSVLMPRLLGRFTNLDDYNNAEEFLALCECLSSIVAAVGEEFNPYAELPFVKCQAIIAENNVDDEYDKDLVCGALQLMVSLAGGLKAQFNTFVLNTNLIDQLFSAMQDRAVQVRQPALALLGELIKFCLPCVSPHLHAFMPIVMENFDKRFNGTANNAAWVITKLAMQLPMHSIILPYIAKVIELAVEILQCTDGVQTMYKTVAITFCSLGLVSPDEVATALKNVMRPLCITIRNVADCSEKEFAFKGLCELILRSPDVFVNDFIFFCDAAASWQTVDKELTEKIRYMILHFRQHIGDEQWAKTFGEFPPLLKNRMNALYGVKCPDNLIAPLVKIVIDEVRMICKKNPIAYGFNTTDNVYDTQTFMHSVRLQVEEVCLRYLDNSMLCTLPSPGPPFNQVSCHVIKNQRARLEDRHVVVHDLCTIFSKEASPSSYYAVFDGHAGNVAAIYGATHLHQFLVESEHFPGNPENALIDAFLKTDSMFLEKSRVENMNAGSTAVCALLRPKEKTLYIAWVGDSEAILVKQGAVERCVQPHKPNRPDEKKRIISQGGCVSYCGVWRVNGLAVSRALGDLYYKPIITAEPEVKEYSLDGTEDFLILACDGLWDGISGKEAAALVYKAIYFRPETVAETIAARLVVEAQVKGSTDNISVIVVFLREPTKIASEPPKESVQALINSFDPNTTNRICTIGSSSNAKQPARNVMEAGFDNANAAATNPFANANGATELLGANDGFMLDIGRLRTGSLAEGFYANGNKNDDMFDDEDDDMGPETDVDALDDVAASPAPAAATAKEVAMGCELEEKVSKEIDASIFKSALNCSVRDLNLDQDEDDEHEEADLRAETPTPPADEVHDAGLDSDSEEDDEWNYIKGAKEQQQQPQQLPASPEQIAEVHTPEQQQQLLPEAIVEGNKESLQPPLPEKDLVDFEPELDFDKAPADASTTEEMDNMSQLNPDAKEFIPVSPTRNIDQPLCAALKDEQILAQSPRRPNPNCDFNLPDEDEFNQDVKNRPSDVYSNGHENGHNKSSQEIMENLLNGKNMDDIEFQPCKPASAGNEEFLFGPNAAAFSTPSKLMDQSRTSTKATFGDESLLDVSENETEGHTDGDLLSRLNKEDDPMSMSFYQDKDDVASPFDLNKVHELPETGDADTSFNETISDMPEHSPSEGMDASENKENIITTDLDAPESCLTGVCELPNSPNVSAFMQTDLDLEDKVVNDLAIQESMESLSEAPNAEISQDVNDRKFVTDDEIIERPQEPLLEIGSASTHPDLIAELDESQPEEIMMEPKAVICFESQDAEMQHDFCAEAVATSTSFSEPELITQTFTQEDIDSQDEQRIEEQQAPAIEDISNSSDVPQHEFILETSLESAQAPEPVIIEQTPEHEVAPELSPEPQLIEESLQEHEHIEAPVLSPIAIVENTPELPPVEAETPIESPIQEQVPIDHSQLDIKQEKDIMQDSLESPLKVVEPVITECLQQQEVAPIGDFTSHNVEEIPSPLDDVTSSVKDDSPVDQSKPIEEISSTIESEIINNTGPQILQEVGKIVDVANVALEKEVIVAPILAATELVQTESKVEKKIASAPKVKQTTTATKKPTSASASKTAAPKPSSKPMPKTTSATAPKTASMKPSTTLKTQKLLSASTAPKPATTGVKAPPKPRVSALSSSTRPTPVSDKKPLTNGDVKSTATKTAPIKRPLVPSKTTTAPASKPATTAAPKLSSRLGTSSSQAKPAPKVSAASTTSAPKPRPTTLASARTKTSTSAAPLSTSTAAKPLTMKTSGSAGAPPKAKPTSAPLSKPRVPLSARSAVAKAPDAEKQNKENVNKLTASRTATTRTTTRKIDSTAKSGLAPKTGTLASKTAASKKAMTSVKSVHKEPKQEKIVPNGVPAEKEKDIVPIDNTKEVSLLKDISPVSNLILDNSQLADTTAN